MKNQCSGIILAGGLNSRFSGKNKAFLNIGGKRIIDHIYDIFMDIFEEVILVTNDPMQYLEWDMKIVTDIFSVRSSLTGLHTGLFYSSNPYTFFVASDTPFLKKELVETVINKIDNQSDVVIPVTSEGMEPLCAAYSKKCLKVAEKQLLSNRFKIQGLFNKVHVKTISEKTLREKDHDLLSFFNINTPEDLTRAEEILSKTT